MNREQEIISALELVESGNSLYELALRFEGEGATQKELYELFDFFRNKYSVDGDEVKYNVILDTMDFISGHCQPNKALFKTIKI